MMENSILYDLQVFEHLAEHERLRLFVQDEQKILVEAISLTQVPEGENRAHSLPLGQD